MKLSELIKQLQELEKQHGGNIDCYAYDRAGDFGLAFAPICHYLREPDGTQKTIIVTIFTCD